MFPLTPLLSEFEPNPAGTDPTLSTIELFGMPGEDFSGFIVAIESDPGTANPGGVNSFAAVSGTFDANGLLVVQIDDLENPSFTIVLTDTFTGDASTDFDSDDDGTIDQNTSLLGTVFDAIGVSDTSGDDGLLYGDDFGGTNVLYNGQFEPLLVFRDASGGAVYNTVTVDFGQPTERVGVFDAAGDEVDASTFDTDPTAGPTFGAVNPSRTGGAVLFSETFDYAEEGAPAAFTLTDQTGPITFFGEPTSFDYFGVFDGDGDGGADFGADAPPTGFNAYTNVADNYLGGSDIDGGDPAIAEPAILTWSGIDITGQSDLVISAALATDDGSGALDPNDFVIFEARVDGGAWMPVLAFETADDSTFNQTTFLQDTDFDGIGDGAALGQAFATFEDGFSVSGSTLDLRLQVRIDAGFEDVGIDSITLAPGTVVEPEPADVLVSDIQGSTDLADGTLVGVAGAADESPLLGQFVRVQAVVTKILPELGGFYVQEEDADEDGDASSSEGIFVAGTAPVGLGDLVTVEGTVAEVEGETRLTATSTSVDIAGTTGLVTPTVIAFPTATVLQTADGDFVANLEAYEGMLVTIPEAMTVTELFQLDRFGTFAVSSEGRLTQFTQDNAPSVLGYAQHLKDIAARTLLIDDGSDAQNPNPIRVPDLGADGTLDAGDVFRMGDFYTGLTGVLSYSEDDQDRAAEEPEYRLHTPDGTLVQANPRPEAPALEADYKVASLNVLNFFTTLDEFPSVGEGSGPNRLEPRGADANPQAAAGDPGPLEEYMRQLDKLVAQIVALDADVLGLVELENDFLSGGAAPTGSGTVVGSGVAVDELVKAVNAEIGFERYDWVRPSTGEFVGTDAIAVGFIYDTTTTALSGASAVLDTEAFIDPNDNTDGGRNRAALAQTFTEIASGESFTASVNHFKSKGSSGLTDTASPDYDLGDGQGFFNDTRTDAARLLADWLASDPTGQGDEDVLILGDLNAYAQEDPIRALEAAGYTDLAQAFLGDEAYSYVFDGQKGTLDYGLANGSLLSQVTGVEEVHFNADEPDAFDYNLEFGRDPSLYTDGPYRASDHDPILIGLDLGPDRIVIAGTDGNDRLNGTDADEILITGGGRLDKVRSGGGSDVIRFVDTEGRRDFVKVLDFDAELDVLDIGDASIRRVQEYRDMVRITLDEDRDTILLRGVCDFDDVQIVSDTLLA